MDEDTIFFHQNKESFEATTKQQTEQQQQQQQQYQITSNKQQHINFNSIIHHVFRRIKSELEGYCW